MLRLLSLKPPGKRWQKLLTLSSTGCEMSMTHLEPTTLVEAPALRDEVDLVCKRETGRISLLRRQEDTQ